MSQSNSVTVFTLSLPENASAPPIKVQSLPGQNDIQVFVVSACNQLNNAVLQTTTEWLLLIQPNCQLASNLLDRIHWIQTQHPKAELLFANDRVGAKLDEKGFSLLKGLQASGVLIKKSFLIEIGGFNETCGSYLEVELFFRCLTKYKDRMGFYSSHELQLQEDPKSAVRLGVERVLQATKMSRNNIGVAPAVWFKQYAEAVELIASDAPDSKLTKASAKSHLQKLAGKVDYWIANSDQAVVGKYLNRSVYEGYAPDCAKEVDKIVKAAFPDVGLGLLALPDELQVFSIGTFCQSAETLKALALRRQKGPFDWIFSSCDAVTHILEDDFKEFMNPVHFERVSSVENPEVLSPVTEHHFYREHYDVRFMFNRHNPLDSADRERYEKAIDTFREATTSEEPCLLLYLTRNEKEYEVIGDIVANLQERGNNNVVLAVCFKQVKDAASQHVKLHTTPDQMVFAAILPVTSASNGVTFSDPDDNIRLARLVHGVTLGRFGVPV